MVSIIIKSIMYYVKLYQFPDECEKTLARPNTTVCHSLPEYYSMS